MSITFLGRITCKGSYGLKKGQLRVCSMEDGTDSLVCIRYGNNMLDWTVYSRATCTYIRELPTVDFFAARKGKTNA